jgi:hypothetical protein
MSRFPAHEPKTLAWSLVTTWADWSPTRQTKMSGPVEPSDGRAVNANQAPSGE